MLNIIHIKKTVFVLCCVFILMNRAALANIEGLSCPVIKQPKPCVASLGKIMVLDSSSNASNLYQELEDYRAKNEVFRQGLENRRVAAENRGWLSQAYFQEMKAYQNGMATYRVRYQQYKKMLKISAKRPL